MTKNCIILHGCPGDEEKALNPEKRTYDKHWIPWTKKQLLKKGIKVTTPHMPKPWKPNYEAFKEEFEKENITNETTLIGHSCGCAFLVNWLGESKQRIKKLILVAPWKVAYREDKSDVEFYGFKIDQTIKERVEEIIMFTADNEDEEGKRSLQRYHAELEGKVIELKSHGHYTIGDMGTEEFPELLKEIET